MNIVTQCVAGCRCSPNSANARAPPAPPALLPASQPLQQAACARAALLAVRRRCPVPWRGRAGALGPVAAPGRRRAREERCRHGPCRPWLAAAFLLLFLLCVPTETNTGGRKSASLCDVLSSSCTPKR